MRASTRWRSSARRVPTSQSPPRVGQPPLLLVWPFACASPAAPQQGQQRHVPPASVFTLTRQAGRLVCARRHRARRHRVRCHCARRHCVYRRHCVNRRRTTGVRRHTAGARDGARLCPFAIRRALALVLALLEVPLQVGFRFVVRVVNHLVVNNLLVGSRMLPVLRRRGVGLPLSTVGPAARDGLGLAALAELGRGGAVGVAVAVLVIGFTRAQDIAFAWAVVGGADGAARQSGAGLSTGICWTVPGALSIAPSCARPAA